MLCFKFPSPPVLIVFFLAFSPPMFGRPQSQSQSRSNRFQPFQRPAPLLSGDTSLSDAFQELKLLNGVEGQLCSWGHGLSNAWDIIPRPQRVTNRGLVDVAASSFIKVWGKDGAPIFCPHTRRNGEAYKPLALRLGGRPLKETNYLTSWDEIRQFQDNNKEEDDDNDSELAPGSSQTSISSSASATATTSVISQLRVKAMVDPDPRYGRHSTGIAPRPRPCATVIGVGTALQSVRKLKSYYSRAVADARKLSNIEIMEFIDQLVASGILAEDPSAHPASDTQQSPPEALQHVYTPLGQAIRALNSAHGIPYADYATLIRYSRSCDSCKNVFSIYGYNDHVVDGRCTNHPDLEEVATLEQDVSPFRFRSFRDGKHPKKIGETLDSPVGAALLEWNSRLGVPTDVWMLISTAVVPCTSCDLVRSLPAHFLHMQDGICTDPGQSLTLEEQDAAM
ncbi:hypothetical protein DFH09DRAFT_1087436 [Mycena vulgaris]|nr:hypothetical protein DFH09DRAFT_1087436 [Mycena vulgaris]